MCEFGAPPCHRCRIRPRPTRTAAVDIGKGGFDSLKRFLASELHVIDFTNETPPTGGMGVMDRGRVEWELRELCAWPRRGSKKNNPGAHFPLDLVIWLSDKVGRGTRDGEFQRGRQR